MPLHPKNEVRRQRDKRNRPQALARIRPTALKPAHIESSIRPNNGKIFYAREIHAHAQAGIQHIRESLSRAPTSLSRDIPSLAHAMTSLARAISSLSRDIPSLAHANASLSRAMTSPARPHKIRPHIEKS
jgi:hypothetical protein